MCNAMYSRGSPTLYSVPDGGHLTCSSDTCMECVYYYTYCYHTYPSLFPKLHTVLAHPVAVQVWYALRNFGNNEGY